METIESEDSRTDSEVKKTNSENKETCGCANAKSQKQQRVDALSLAQKIATEYNYDITNDINNSEKVENVELEQKNPSPSEHKRLRAIASCKDFTETLEIRSNI